MKRGEIIHIQITKTAIKTIKKLDTVTRERILNGIKQLPFGDVKKLQGYSDFYRLRIGNYRILYTSDGNNIIVSDVLPRGEAYKRI